jgi:hypothetical protein
MGVNVCFSPQTHRCCGDNLLCGKFDGCCGNICYEPLLYDCCDEKLCQKGDDLCCGAPHEEIWSLCGAPTDLLTILDVVISPQPIKRGDLLTVTVSGVMAKAVTAGTVEFNLMLGGVSILQQTNSLCDLILNLCPIEEGYVTRTYSHLIPADLPAAHFSGMVKVFNDASEEIACVNVDLDLL